LRAFRNLTGFMEWVAIFKDSSGENVPLKPLDSVRKKTQPSKPPNQPLRPDSLCAGVRISGAEALVDPPLTRYLISRHNGFARPK